MRPLPAQLETIQRATNQRIAVKMKPQMTVPQSESNGFFTYSLLEFVSSN